MRCVCIRVSLSPLFHYSYLSTVTLWLYLRCMSLSQCDSVSGTSSVTWSSSSVIKFHQVSHFKCDMIIKCDQVSHIKCHMIIKCDIWNVTCSSSSTGICIQGFVKRDSLTHMASGTNAVSLSHARLFALCAVSLSHARLFALCAVSLSHARLFALSHTCVHWWLHEQHTHDCTQRCTHMQPTLRYRWAWCCKTNWHTISLMHTLIDTHWLTHTLIYTNFHWRTHWCTHTDA